MKRIVGSLVMTFFVFYAHAQNFEGKIVYANSYKSKNANLTTEQLTSMMGDTEEYYISNGRERTVMNGTVFQWQLYVREENKLYTKVSNYETVLWNDGAENKDTVLTTEIVKNVGTILHYPCDVLILTTNSGTEKYYYSDSLQLNADLYKQHAYGNWNTVVSLTHAMPLKMILDKKDIYAEMIATSVTSTKLDDSLFVLPPGTKSVKSPF